LVRLTKRNFKLGAGDVCDIKVVGRKSPSPQPTPGRRIYWYGPPLKGDFDALNFRVAGHSPEMTGRQSYGKTPISGDAAYFVSTL
jgi:hypothetical protein